MRAFAVICVLLPNILDAALSPGFKVRHNKGDDTYSYYDLPQTKADALAQGWEENVKPEGPSQYKALTLLCKESDKTICILFDIKGNAAGVQINVNKKYLTDMPFNMPKETMANWTATENGTTTEFWVSTMYFVSNDSAVNTVAKNSSQFLPEDGIFLSSYNGSIYKMYTKIDKNTDFTEQNCIAALGDHYFYKMTSSLECSANTIFPWFYLTQDSDITSMAWYIIGNRTLPDGQWDWLEHWNRSIVEAGVKDGPACLYEFGESPGVIGFKLFFVNDPEAITC